MPDLLVDHVDDPLSADLDLIFVGVSVDYPIHRLLRGGLPTVYQGLFSVAREGLKVVPVFNMAQATLRRRSAIDRKARPWL